MKDLAELLKLMKVVSPEEAEACDFVVCGPRRCFTDDVETTCALCEAPIFHRPHAPRRPPKVCMSCAEKTMGNAN